SCWFESSPGSFQLPDFDQGMAVGAEQHALPSLRPQLVDRACDAAQGEPKRLLRRVEVVKLEGGGVPVEPTQCTLAARLAHQYLLDLSAPLRHCGHAALGTAVVAATLEHEPGGSVFLARRDRR